MLKVQNLRLCFQPAGELFRTGFYLTAPELVYLPFWPNLSLLGSYRPQTIATTQPVVAFCQHQCLPCFLPSHTPSLLSISFCLNDKPGKNCL